MGVGMTGQPNGIDYYFGERSRLMDYVKSGAQDPGDKQNAINSLNAINDYLRLPKYEEDKPKEAAKPAATDPNAKAPVAGQTGPAGAGYGEQNGDGKYMNPTDRLNTTVNPDIFGTKNTTQAPVPKQPASTAVIPPNKDPAAFKPEIFNPYSDTGSTTETGTPNANPTQSNTTPNAPTDPFAYLSNYMSMQGYGSNIINNSITALIGQQQAFNKPKTFF